MTYNWRREFWQLCIILAASWLGGFIVGSVSWALVLGLLIFIGIQVRCIWRFMRWMDSGRAETGVHDIPGFCGSIAYRVDRIRKRNHNRTKRLSEILRRFQESASALPDAAIVLEADCSIVYFNHAASTMLGLRQNDHGFHIGNLIRNPSFNRFLRTSNSNDHLEIPSPLDPSKTLEIRIAPYGANQRLMQVSDITHIQRLMTMRRDFVANVSHELRTPLTVILGYLETLQECDDHDVQSLLKQLAKLEAPAMRMKYLVEDLLLLSRLDTGEPLTPEASPLVNVSTMIKTIAVEAEHISNSRHRISMAVDESLKLRGDERELYSAFVNLVNNAIRYTPEGGRITIRWEELNGGAHYSVEDTGMGIAPEHIPRLTERFYRVDVSRSRNHGGTGLGLAIVKQVLRRHNAELDVSSALGKGSVFRCVFPSSRVVIQPKAQYKKSSACS